MRRPPHVPPPLPPLARPPHPPAAAPGGRCPVWAPVALLLGCAILLVLVGAAAAIGAAS